MKPASIVLCALFVTAVTSDKSTDIIGRLTEIKTSLTKCNSDLSTTASNLKAEQTENEKLRQEIADLNARTPVCTTSRPPVDCEKWKIQVNNQQDEIADLKAQVGALISSGPTMPALPTPSGNTDLVDVLEVQSTAIGKLPELIDTLKKNFAPTPEDLNQLNGHYTSLIDLANTLTTIYNAINEEAETGKLSIPGMTTEILESYGKRSALIPQLIKSIRFANSRPDGDDNSTTFELKQKDMLQVLNQIKQLEKEVNILSGNKLLAGSKDITNLLNDEIDAINKIAAQIPKIEEKYLTYQALKLKNSKLTIDQITGLIKGVEIKNAQIAGGNVVFAGNGNSKIESTIIDQFGIFGNLDQILHKIETTPDLDGTIPNINQQGEYIKQIINQLGKLIENDKKIENFKPSLVSGSNSLTNLVWNQHQMIENMLNKSNAVEKNLVAIKELPPAQQINPLISHFNELSNLVISIQQPTDELNALPGNLKTDLINLKNKDIGLLTTLIDNLKSTFQPSSSLSTAQHVQNIHMGLNAVIKAAQSLNAKDLLHFQIPAVGSSGSVPGTVEKQLQDALIANSNLIDILNQMSAGLNGTSALNGKKQVELLSPKPVKLICAPSFDQSECVIKGLNVKDSNTRITDVAKSGLVSLDLKKITKVVIDGENALFLPMGLNSFFPNLKELSITNSKLLVLRADDFKDLTSLEVLDLSNNQLKEISPEVLATLKNLKRLDLSYNQIENIGIDTFDNLPNLREVKLNNNQLEKIKFDIFEQNTLLEKVSLQGNNLKELNLKFVKNLENIGFVNLMNNVCINDITLKGKTDTLDKIRSQCASGVGINCRFSDSYKCTATLVVTKAKTRITEANGKHAFGMTDRDVNELIIDHQTVWFMPEGLGEVFINLAKITIDNSELSQITRAGFSQISGLKELTIVNNEILTIDADSFSSNMQLESLNLGNNKLKKLPSNVFGNLRNLRALKLNDNDFKELYMNSLDCPTSIEKFDFSNNNQMKSIQANIVNICLKKASDIDFTGVKCLKEAGIVDYRINRKSTNEVERSRMYDEMFGTLETKCPFPQKVASI